MLRTIVPGSAQEFACPACGVPMSLRNPGSFELNLTINARKEFNEIIMQYAAFLAHFEAEATSRNIASSTRDDTAPYAHRVSDDLPERVFTRGIFTTKGADLVREQWWERFDHYAFHRLIHEDLLPIAKLEAALAAAKNGAASLGGGASGYEDAEPPFAAVVEVLLGGIEPLRMMGHVMSLVFDQPQIRRWLTATAPDSPGARPAEDKVAALCGKPQIAPTLSRYLALLEDVLGKPELIRQLIGEEQVENAGRMLGELRRVRLMLVLLLGHESPDVWTAFPGLVEPHVPYTLPRRVVVAPKLLPLLFVSASAADLTGLRLSEDYFNLLAGDGARPGDLGAPAPGDVSATVAEFVELLGPDTHKLVVFVCRGPSGRPINPSAQPGATSPDYAAKEPDFCGWYPKAEQTHPVVFIGSPGTSKSTLMLTGLLQFYNNAQALGATVGFQSDKDLREYDSYVDRYWQGILPDPTPTGARNSIQLRVESTKVPSLGANFVFTDIPGEKAARSVRGEGADPIVLGVLKHAETLVFLFDLSIEQAVLKQLEHSHDSAQWQALLRNTESVLEARTSKNADGTPKDESSRARVSQLDLLERMISDLREIRGDDLRGGGPNVVCIIPKADLYVGPLGTGAHPGEPQVKFLTAFYESLIADGVLARSARSATVKGGRADGGEADIAAYRSAAGYGWKAAGPGAAAGKVAELGHPVVQQQLKLARTISDRAREALGALGDALGHQPTDQQGGRTADTQSLSDLVRSRLIDRLESVFRKEDVYFLPISAQGSDNPPKRQPTEDGADPVRQPRLSHPPNAKLSEYAFMLPVFLSLRELMATDH
ncbi:hypothetical protein KDK95_16530 [Actinospica sp. MGRD01-02]|uniref:Uncharacterized protein n=1 Tax=Actinospica acidithermotolerans TaxID=2828514 RepID=A0A941IGY4_9ACTN|nr:hypothetical protein [Actinospica acidithermotolerans]MBR7827925.1 hypothetical protein [Actinospica acidithermotolerans]